MISCSDFQLDLTATYGSCFTFNYNPASIRKFTRAGSRQGKNICRKLKINSLFWFRIGVDSVLRTRRLFVHFWIGRLQSDTANAIRKSISRNWRFLCHCWCFDISCNQASKLFYSTLNYGYNYFIYANNYCLIRMWSKVVEIAWKMQIHWLTITAETIQLR